MEYTEMIDKVKALAEQDRTVKTIENKTEVRRQMNVLRKQDPKAFAVAVGYMTKTTRLKVKELAMAEKNDENADMLSMDEIAKACLMFFGLRGDCPSTDNLP